MSVTTIQNKYCGRCDRDLDISNFNKHSGTKDGYQTQCKECIKEQRQEWAKDPLKRRKRKLMSKYGLTLEDYDNMLKAQDYKCKICGTEDTRNKSYKFFPVDHCHRTGKVRGLLCDYCNVGLGRFEDDPKRLKKAIEYLNAI
jgi:hypothetical protein